ncbi:Hypothetical predicted protein [Paramuricea clavata]|uniref:DUF6589 domain-containing protein n=1 Tax=Paramuricea clavata TaxID=317549 RepID=A0A6S7FGY0_PARCT|nr:Hypothetical predicted protein [Paramuricea clavata]
MKLEDTKHPERTGKWLLISYIPAWNVFKSHTVVLQDDATRDRINRLIDSITDPFSTEIRYHHKCWLKYIGAYQKIPVEQHHERAQKNQSEVVYDTAGGASYIESTICSLGISNEQLVENVASRLRKEVKQTTTISWPPQVVELEQEENLPPLLVQLISSLKKPGQVEQDAKVRALASMITYYVTGSPTTTAVNLSMNLHGLTRSQELVDTFHKCGVGINYSSVLLLRDAWAVHGIQLCSECPNEIAEKTPGVIVVDNDDFQNETLTGGDTSHRTNSGERVKNAKTLSSRLKNIATGMNTHDRYVTYKRGEPTVSVRVEPKVGSTVPQRKRCVIHTLVRANAAGERPPTVDQMVPGFAGFQALISTSVEKSKPYYFMIYPDPRKKAVLNDVLVKANKAIQRKNMPFAVVVGDQPVYTLLVEIKSEHPEKFEKIIPFLGPFHIQGSMIYAIYKRHKGSEIADVLVAAGVIAEGSVDQALRGKHYKRALRCLMLMYESFMHLLLNQFHEESQLEASTMTRLAILRDPKANSQDSLATAQKELENDPAVDTLINNMFDKIEKTDMACYWLDFMTMVEILMMNVYAIHTCNWDEFLTFLREMMPWMVIYDQTHYGRWLPHFWAMLSSLSPDQTQFFSSNFAQSITGNPFSCIPWDMWIEMTMNKGLKLKAGWLSILRNEKQLMTDIRNANNLGRVRTAVHNQINRKQISRTHSEFAPTRMCKDEQAVQDLIACIKEFDCFPFDVSSPNLRTLQSAIPAPTEMIRDFQTAKQDGETKLKEFMDECVYSKEKSLYDRIKRHSRLTFAKAPTTKTGEVLKVKQGEMENRALASVVNLVDVSGLMMLSDVMKYRITEECLTLFNVNGTFRKTQKSKILQKLTQEPIDVSSYTALVDMGMIWRLASPTMEDREKNDGSTYTWGNYTDKVTSMLLARHVDATTIICINDPYDHVESIKDDELGVECVNLSSGSIQQDLAFDQCEADTIILSFYTALRASGYNDPVIIDAADTDVYIQAAAISHDVPGIICIKKKKELLFCRGMCADEDIAKCLIQFHVMTGCDANSCFYGHGKSTLYDKMVKSVECRRLLSSCEESLPLKEDVLNDLVSYVTRFVYGDVHSSSLDIARAAKWKGQKNKSLMRLPPDSDSLKQHILRANYLAYIQRHPELRTHPSPVGHGWELINGCCKPVRHTQPPLPLTLSNTLPPHDSDIDSEFSDVIDSDLDTSSDEED